MGNSNEYKGDRNKRRVEQRRNQAIGRQQAYDALTPQQKLQRLDSRLGKGVGAEKERARLQAQLAESSNVQKLGYAAGKKATRKRKSKRDRNNG